MASEHRNALPSGYEFDGYRIESVLGAGGFGITYLASETSINRHVAIKEYLPSGLAMRGRDEISVHPLSTGAEDDFEWGLSRFRSEAETLVSLRHPNIVAVLRFIESHGTACLVMEYTTGESLHGWLGRGDRLTEAEVRDLLMPLLDGIETVHTAGILHRDIKPANIYIREDGSPLLLDFGAARYALGAASQSFTTMLSVGYAPFEQYTSRGNLGPWTDIYAMGATLYHVVAGARPPDSTDRSNARLRGNPDPMIPARTAAANNYGADLLAAIDGALEVLEEDRPQDISAFRTLLTSAPKVPSRPELASNGETIVQPTAAPLDEPRDERLSETLALTDEVESPSQIDQGVLDLNNPIRPRPAQYMKTALNGDVPLDGMNDQTDSSFFSPWRFIFVIFLLLFVLLLVTGPP